MKRGCGILLHLSSLPSPYGIGTMGKCAYRFVDFLKASGQTYWQVLPLCMTGFGDSPYQSVAGFAGNPYFIDLDLLYELGLLSAADLPARDTTPGTVDYAALYHSRYAVLRKAYQNGYRSLQNEIRDFADKNRAWLEDFALFMALKEKHCGAPWYLWEEPLKQRDAQALQQASQDCVDEIRFHQFMQYLFYRQWSALRSYANDNGISVIGDIPIYVSHDSCDVWSHPDIFMLDEHRNPTLVAGCPPDAFSASGQLWGNPVYRWDVLEQRHFDWWTERLRHCQTLYDSVRIDHFRGFDAFWAVPFGSTTAENGKWYPAPGLALFRELQRQLPQLSVIAEDLGFLTPSVIRLRDSLGICGTKVLLFAFDPREQSNHLPHFYPGHSVVYTGTHDNDTVEGWRKSAPNEAVSFASQYLHQSADETLAHAFIRGAYASVSDIAIIPMQDVLGLDNRARMNTPSTASQNWCWRMSPTDLSHCLADELHRLAVLYGRCPKYFAATD